MRFRAALNADAASTTHIMLSAMALLQRFSWQVPPLRIHPTRYHGDFAPAPPWRSRVAPRPPPQPP